MKSPEFEARYFEHRLRQIEDSHVNATLLGLLVVPAASALDWFTQREHFGSLSWVRYALALVFLVFHLQARRGIRPGGVTFTAVLLLLLSAISITAMCVITGGYDSPYYAGIGLLILTCVTFQPGSVRVTAGVLIANILVYIAGVLLTEHEPLVRVSVLINNLWFLTASSTIGFAAVIFNERIRRESFSRLLRAEGADAINRAYSAVTRALGIRDEFISIASHELKTPITSMKLQNQILRRVLLREGMLSDFAREKSGGEWLEQWILRNDHQIRRMTRLIEDMLDISRINTGKLEMAPEEFDLGEILAETVERFQSQLQSQGIVIQLDLPSGIRGSWDRLRIEQIMSNLLSNAIKYAPSCPLGVTLSESDGVALLQVRDHGPGIAPENWERIFHRFERAHSASGTTGLGLGLYITRTLVESHGGRIWVVSERGEGSTFSVTLPLGLDAVGLRRETKIDLSSAYGTPAE